MTTHAGEPVGVLLMTGGSPETLDDVEDYMKAARGGAVSRELVDKFKERYRVMAERITPALNGLPPERRKWRPAMNEDHRGRFLQACRLQPTDVVPVWFMRQAGSHSPAHRAMMERYGLVQLTATPELCAAATCLPLNEARRRLGPDMVLQGI